MGRRLTPEEKDRIDERVQKTALVIKGGKTLEMDLTTGKTNPVKKKRRSTLLG